MALRVVRNVRVEINGKGVENVPAALEARQPGEQPRVLGCEWRLEVVMHAATAPTCGSVVLCGGERIGVVDSVYSNNGCVWFTVAVLASANDMVKRWQAGDLDAQPLRIVSAADQEPAGLSYAEMQLLQQFEDVRFRPFNERAARVAVAIAAEIQARGLTVRPVLELFTHPTAGLNVRLDAGRRIIRWQVAAADLDHPQMGERVAEHVAQIMRWNMPGEPK